MERVLKINDRRFTRQAIAGLVVVFLLQLIVVASAFLTYSRNAQSGERVEHTHRVLDRLARIEVMIERTETASRGYLLSPDPRRARTFESNANGIPAEVNRLAELISDNPAQKRRLASLTTDVEAELKVLNRVMDIARAGRFDDAVQTFQTDAPQRRLARIRDLSAAMAATEKSLLDTRRAEERRSGALLKAVLGIAALLMLLAGGAIFFVARRYIDDLSYARDRLTVLNTDLEGEVERRTTELRRANDEVQRFAYIVSHDLRSPLVNILGFTAELQATNKILGDLIAQAEAEAPQLLSREVREAQADLPEAIGFIRASTQKMDRLINAILRLSREGRRTLTPESLPMDRVIDDIAGSLKQRIDGAAAELVIEKPLPELTHDRVAIEQIFSNLIENAVKYLSPNRPGKIVVRGDTQGERAIFEIQDNGRGIDPKDHQRVFDLFRRSGVQDVAGEGIGLAQVRALVNRLGGFIDIASQLDEGATFRLNLPITYTDPGNVNE